MMANMCKKLGQETRKLDSPQSQLNFFNLMCLRAILNTQYKVAFYLTKNIIYGGS